MTYARELLETAQVLLQCSDVGSPSRSNCNRAVSTLYYALFDCVCTAVANRAAGKLDEKMGPTIAWTKIYRSLDHKFVRDTLQSVANVQGVMVKSNCSFVATAFSKILQHREEADYDRRKDFAPETIQSLINEVTFAILLLENEFDLDDDATPSFSDLIVALLLPKPKR